MQFSKLGRFGCGLLFFFLTYALPLPAGGFNADSINPICVDWLRIIEEQKLLQLEPSPEKKPDIKRLLSGIEISPVGVEGEEGFTVRKKEGSREASKEIHLSSADNDFRFLNRQVWALNQNKYYFTDVGFKNLKAYSESINKIIIDHLQESPGRNLEVLYDPVRILAGELLTSYRWSMHDAVLTKYRTKKKYLTPEDFLILTQLNGFSKNNDVFGLMTYDSTPLPIVISRQEISDRLLMTIQVSYFGDRDFLRPSIQNLLNYEISPAESSDRFPFEFRLPRSKISAEFRRNFRIRFDPRYTCEILRYASFDPYLPIEVEDRFIFDVFNSILDQGIRHIVISVDAATGRLFHKRYGFVLYRELPIPHEGTKEYLYYVDTDSPQFFAAYYALKENAKKVDVSMEAP